MTTTDSTTNTPRYRADAADHTAETKSGFKSAESKSAFKTTELIVFVLSVLGVLIRCGHRQRR